MAELRKRVSIGDILIKFQLSDHFVIYKRNEHGENSKQIYLFNKFFH